MESLNFSVVRWVANSDAETLSEYENQRCMLVFDHFMRPLLLFANQYTMDTFAEKHEELQLVEALDVESELK